MNDDVVDYFTRLTTGYVAECWAEIEELRSYQEMACDVASYEDYYVEYA